MTLDPSTHQLRLLLVLAEELHFGRAAKRAFISQPAFSRQIRALEEHLGVALLERSTRQVELTKAGRALLPQIRAVIDALTGLHAAAEAEAASSSGSLVLGTYLSGLPALRVLFDSMRTERQPGPEVEWREIDLVDHSRAVLEGQLDAIVCFEPVAAGLRTLRLGTESRYVCLPDTHPLADRDAVTLAELSGLPVIGFSPQAHAEYRAFWAADPRPDGSAVRYTPHEVTNLERCVTLVGLGHGIRFFPDSVRVLMPRPAVRYVAVTDLSPCAVVLAWAADRPVPPALRSLLQMLRKHAHAMESRGLGSTGRRWWDALDEL
ncbi:LysR substrate-binding domain-containing protein [Streptomyces sp. RY43-2]|uniref:LysR substrate-binding domain-containing protein n=1 Tax=Streptomyces macrolidinus TaxID=2952607 RepID=A0ABT0ZE14_9ACTN|nr:LysR substrate-binding domain-containing protein [Streptomyces macrolidinus]MCN9241804.1 LysR substrate-binding domain-containing protein [Streptomyces macrolidinus]